MKFKTKTKGKTLNPKWNESFTFNVAFYKDGPVPPLQIEVMDKDLMSDDSLGTVDVDLHQVVDNFCKVKFLKFFDIFFRKFLYFFRKFFNIFLENFLEIFRNFF